MANTLLVAMKQFNKIDVKTGKIDVTWNTVIIDDDTAINEPLILQYEFTNLGDKKCFVNNQVLQPGSVVPFNPNNKWVPSMNGREIDTTRYQIVFEK